MNRKTLLILIVLFSSLTYGQESKKPYHFDGNISEEVLRNYLARSVTMTEVCVNSRFKIDGEDYTSKDNIRLIKNIDAKLIGRALFRWGGEQILNDPEFFSYAATVISEVHKFDPDVVFQAAVFEAVSVNVEKVGIPASAFEAYGLPVQQRNFSYDAMLFPSGKYKNHWGKGSSVPDVTQIETKLWLHFLATKYIDTGFEGIHWGQVALMGANDPELAHWFELLAMIRKYAKEHSRRHFVLNDAHAPAGGFIKDGELLFDFHSFPLRIKAKSDEPEEGMLEDGYYDAIYNKSFGGKSASGWSCENLPYIVEFDNFGISSDPGNPVRGAFIWGYDEISWFSLKSIDDQKAWLEYAYNWVQKTDPDGYLQMPVCRIVTNGIDKSHKYKANIKSADCPDGTGLETKIKELWSK